MKKIIITLFLLVSMFSFSDSKSDYELAVSKYNQTNSLDEFEKDLDKIGKQNYDNYMVQSNLLVSEIKTNKGEYKEAKQYLDRILLNKSATDGDKEVAYLRHYQIGILNGNVKERIWSIDKLVELLPDNLNYKILQISDYKEDKNKNLDTILSQTLNKLSIEDQELFLYSLSNIFIERKQYDFAKEYANNLIKRNTISSKIYGNLILSDVSKLESNISNSIKYLEEASKLSKQEDASIELKLANLYVVNNQKEKALDKFKLASELSPDTLNNVYVILQAEELNKKDLVDEHVKLMKSKLGKSNWYLIDKLVLEGAVNSNLLNIAEKYAKKVIETNSKDVNAYQILLEIYVANSRKKDAQDLVKLMRNNGIDIDNQTEKIIENLK